LFHGSTVTTGAATLSVAALGDSIPAGANCAGCTPFVDLFARQLGDRLSAPVRAENLGVGGWTTADLLSSLDNVGDDAAVVRDADIVTVTIGANDFESRMDSYVDGSCGGSDRLECFGPALEELRSTLLEVLRRVAEIRAGRHTAVLMTGYWDVFPDGDVALAQFGPEFLTDSAVLTRRVNAVIADLASDQGATYVDLFSLFKGSDGDRNPTDELADDGDHPNQDGHQSIADALTTALASVRDHGADRSDSVAGRHVG
jgi:lysophospholipase L1-like esterase